MLEWPNMYDYRWMIEYLDAICNFGKTVYMFMDCYIVILYLQITFDRTMIFRAFCIELKSSFWPFICIYLDEKKIQDY